jgi:hypothetical protein
MLITTEPNLQLFLGKGKKYASGVVCVSRWRKEEEEEEEGLFANLLSSHDCVILKKNDDDDDGLTSLALYMNFSFY